VSQTPQHDDENKNDCAKKIAKKVVIPKKAVILHRIWSGMPLE
jgi:hypothetical protein